MNGLIDIHSHTLPLVDDGAETVEMALLMLRTAAEEEIEKIILTPHQKADRRCVTPEGILRRMEELQELEFACKVRRYIQNKTTNFKDKRGMNHTI